MKGKFLVASIQREPTGSFFVGKVTAGHLKAGMESRMESSCIVIREILSADAAARIVDEAKKGDAVALHSDPIQQAEAQAFKESVLEFTDTQSIQLKKGLILKPDIG